MVFVTARQTKRLVEKQTVKITDRHTGNRFSSLLTVVIHIDYNHILKCLVICNMHTLRIDKKYFM